MIPIKASFGFDTNGQPFPVNIKTLRSVATKQSSVYAAYWIASLTLAMTRGVVFFTISAFWAEPI